MRSFSVQAICDETVLWDVLTMLEQYRCADILSRPAHANHSLALPPPHRKSVRKGEQLAVAESYVREAVPITPKGLKELLDKSGYTHVKPHRLLFILKTKGVIRQTGMARYQLTKKGAA